MTIPIPNVRSLTTQGTCGAETTSSPSPPRSCPGSIALPGMPTATQEMPRYPLLISWGTPRHYSYFVLTYLLHGTPGTPMLSAVTHCMPNQRIHLACQLMGTASSMHRTEGIPTPNSFYYRVIRSPFLQEYGAISRVWFHKAQGWAAIVCLDPFLLAKEREHMEP